MRFVYPAKVQKTMGKKIWIAGAVLALTSIIAVPGVDDYLLPDDPSLFPVCPRQVQREWPLLSIWLGP